MSMVYITHFSLDVQAQAFCNWLAETGLAKSARVIENRPITNIANCIIDVPDLLTEEERLRMQHWYSGMALAFKHLKGMVQQ